ncbi:hypothetical protein AN948_03400 [Rhodococcus sp. ADH]|uniref:hypothetical protein n=1 Tax=Rhodococcus sp. ADH TaxID=224843 RepID=UPI0006BA0E6C|nr:hypothetical protein [Rhodococcus sp. ADH]KPH21110.1 hypothetical protein AN948_03400 [Rhodococcus sp. ADH]RGP46756.1 hypothetical protein AWH04_07860 [Rhodococcus erythropolis]
MDADRRIQLDDAHAVHHGLLSTAGFRHLDERYVREKTIRVVVRRGRDQRGSMSATMAPSGRSTRAVGAVVGSALTDHSADSLPLAVKAVVSVREQHAIAVCYLPCSDSCLTYGDQLGGARSRGCLPAVSGSRGEFTLRGHVGVIYFPYSGRRERMPELQE